MSVNTMFLQEAAERMYARMEAINANGGRQGSEVYRSDLGFFHIRRVIQSAGVRRVQVALGAAYQFDTREQAERCVRDNSGDFGPLL